MALIKSILFAYTLHIIEYAHCCSLDDDDGDLYCNTFLELSMEGQPEWTNVSVVNFNEEPLHILQANSFEKVPNIQDLTIHNAINGIEPGAFNSLKKLTELHLFYNEITVLPAKIFNVKSLKVVELIANDITDIPPDSFKKIETVSFEKNRIGEIKAGIFSDSAIRVLAFDGCEIEAIEDGSFMRMNSLYVLAITRNMITSFNVKRLMGNSLLLEVLYVDFNRLTSVPRDMFDGAERLYIVSLEGNRIESIEDGAFSRLEYLGVLDLSDNRLVQVQPQILRAPHQPSLKVLALHDNRLTFINLALLARAYRLVYFAYGGNPIQCPCITDIKDYVRKQNIQQTCFDKLYFSGDFPTCVVPLDYADVCLYDADLRSDLYEHYKVARVEYTKFQKLCNISADLNKAIYRTDTQFHHLLDMEFTPIWFNY